MSSDSYLFSFCHPKNPLYLQRSLSGQKVRKASVCSQKPHEGHAWSFFNKRFNSCISHLEHTHTWWSCYCQCKTGVSSFLSLHFFFWMHSPVFFPTHRGKPGLAESLAVQAAAEPRLRWTACHRWCPGAVRTRLTSERLQCFFEKEDNETQTNESANLQYIQLSYDTEQLSRAHFQPLQLVQCQWPQSLLQAQQWTQVSDWRVRDIKALQTRQGAHVHQPRVVEVNVG